MADIAAPRPLREGDGRTGFDCDREALNRWLARRAWANQQANVSRTNVICEVGADDVVGYVSLSAAQIARGHLAKSAQRNRPDPIPILLLGQLAIDRCYQGRGLAASLLKFTFATALRFSREIGCYGVLTHPLDDDVRAFYARFGFTPLPFDPMRSMLVRMIDLEGIDWEV